MLHALWREFTKEVSLLNDTADSNSIELKSDPEEIVELFFSQLKEEINNLMHAEEIDWEEAGLIMFDAMVAGELDSRVDDDEFDFQRFFEAGLDALLDLFLMADSPLRYDILNALQKRFIVDTSLAEDDAETRTGELLANVSKEILHSATETGMNRFEAARIYFEKLIHREETANQSAAISLPKRHPCLETSIQMELVLCCCPKDRILISMWILSLECRQLQLIVLN